jgi:peptidoglycan/xylan/chitin deacetylase (PgdA/CDA1 family)
VLITRLILPILLSFMVLCPSQTLAQHQNQAVILQYHHVSTQTPPITSLSPEAFNIHMNYLDDNGFTLLALEDVVESLKNGELLPDKTAVITFDDGYTSVFEVAYPILQARGWPFTVFVTTGLVGSNDRLYSTWEQIREMASGGATIANHTVSHPYLIQHNGASETEWLQGVEAEIMDAEEAIRRETGQQHKLLAYPYGEYNPAIQTLVNTLGFTGIAQHSGPINSNSDFSALSRFPFSGIYASMNSFPTKVMSLAFNLDSVSPTSPITSSPSPAATLDFSVNQTGLTQLACFNNNEMIEVNAVDRREFIYQVNTRIENRSRRFRYNCTAPGGENRYYWYSIPWINPDISE